MDGVELRLGEEVKRRREHAAEGTASVDAARYRDAMPDSERVPFPPELHAELAAIVGAAGVTTSPAELERHGHDESYHRTSAPDVVCFPTSTAQVAAVVGACAARRVPMVAFGAGSSLEGHVAALRGGVSIDTTRMARILRVSVEDLDVTVEAGVTRLQLERRLREDGVFFPVDPGADATLGGMVSTGASGTMAVRYGTMRENVLSLTVVTADGATLRTRSRARKSSAGYDLTHLFVGAEGTLGIVTEITLRVQPLPEAAAAAVASFPSVHAAVECAIATIQAGIPVARIELLDELQMDAVLRRHPLPYTVAPTLLLEFHGSPDGVAEQAARTGEVATAHGCPDFTWAADEAARQGLWRARHHAYESALALRPGSRGLTTDVCVPISRLADCVVETQADIAESGLVAPIVGHVGDGNFHVCVVLDPDDPTELERAKALNARLVSRALGMGGTCTGEHGVGLGKSAFLAQEHDPAALALMRALKHALDPRDLMNPGKIATPLAAEPATAAAATA